MQISETLAALRKEAGLSQTEVAKYMTQNGCAVTHKAVSKWESGDTQPSASQFLLLCGLYGVSDVLTVFCGSGIPALNDLGRQRMIEYMRLLQSSGRYLRKPKPARSIPLYDLPVSAGTGQFLDSDRYELIDAGDDVPQEATFAVRIAGDSMEPRYEDGQIVYAKQQQNISDGEYGIFIYNGDAYCKRFSADGRLISLNTKYAPILIAPEDELRVIGKVLS